MAEVAGGTGVLVDPSSPEAIAEGITTALSRHDELAAAGIARAASFTWSAAADRVEALWRELA
jgi:glycosyltransferase involved in cell wall biosynthesis